MLRPARAWASWLMVSWGVLAITPVAAAPQDSPAASVKSPKVSAGQPPSSSSRQTPGVTNRTTPAALEQPGVLAPLFERLLRLISSEAVEAVQPVHIIHFGDSHTTADEWTGALRDLLKGRFGDGGSGFSLAGHPFPGYRRFDAKEGGSSGWQTLGLRDVVDGLLGLGGLGISTGRAGESVFIETSCEQLEVHYLQQRGGGALALYDGDLKLTEFSTGGELGPGLFSYQCPPGPHRFKLKTLSSRPVRLFGWVADRGSGATYEALGINGTEASRLLRWDEQMLSTYLRSRKPALIVLAYGTNEALESKGNSESYRKMFSTLLERLQHACPAASIMVIGPPDCWRKTRGRWQPFPGLDGIIAAQQSACLERGCAFWDTRDRMGGTGSMRQWVEAGLAQRDFVHFTAEGYRRLASDLFTDLMTQYELFRRVRSELAEPISHADQNR